MISSPVNWIFTFLFAATGLYCLWNLARARRAATSRERSGGLSTAEVVDVNHVVMSAAMILMVWVAVGDAVLWMQVAVFAVLALSLIPGLRSAAGKQRVDVVAHIGLDGAMIWMLIAMPALMAGMDMGGSGGDSHHSGHTGDDMSMGMSSTPGWVDVTNWAFVAACVAVALWWLVRLLGGRDHRLHALCHLLMGAGMAAMLVAMNG